MMVKLKVHFPGHEWHGKAVERVAEEKIAMMAPGSAARLIVPQILVRGPNGEERWFHPNHLKPHA